ncbi:MAG: CHAT domain-containing protein [Oscillatoriales cyanobacterium]|uniref:CHAT domain-containing protein n=1 Tax=unclassified Microcoleus TaxID=2642155 RepID=UPI001D929BFB|nr:MULTISPECIES: CHAT domain-containing tetratricopeptide repeat protein [unclassified Microcoleus]TAG02900.1 MAG: CHAT domain-containing protein [Oscillatoriales cyanobacterium]MCC3438637.1 CHAT domain-containing protein [Microcoleus sp. PH2017_05_CCC_O_A]MCC3588018.1 CHAT domain-containing protein [Microcoleus sp. PH2017_30_WIL_O_A]TAG12688.1 MAG: CHAT domain-containing protein [Oscillatoriales cyanobacterium]TAG35022.1 MAG: CHAT domain-containing protein [Oscillatoriales cyanobacterium]
MNEKRRESYLTLIQSLLTCPSDEEITILQNNLELLDDGFAQYLREWATQTLAEMESEEAYNFAGNLYNFNITISSFPLGSRAANIEIAIACLEVGLIIFTREAYPKNWGYNQNSLGIKYSDRIKEDRAENIERAIACYDLALLVRTRATFPQDWADTQICLGSAYSDRIKGDRGENLERAIAFYEAALEVHTRQAFPERWAMTQNNLANAYSHRIRGDRGENIEKAIECYEAALEVRTRQALPQDWATTQNNLAAAYSNRIREDRAENIERAIKCSEAALEVYTRPALPQDWAMTQENLAYAYQEKGLIPEAIKYFKLSLEILKPDTLPLSCLKAARSLGNIGFTESLWETAIFGYEKAIEAVEQSREWIASENRKREIIGENLNVYEKMIQSCINHHQYHKAIQTIERSKSRYLVELFTNSEIYPKTATATEKQQLQNLRRQIISLQQSPQQQQDNLATALQQLEQYLEIFKQREPEFKLTQKIQPIDIPEFQKTLDTETAIVEWYIGGHGGTAPTGGFAFIITHNNIELITYTTTEIAELETWKNDYLNEYRDKDKQKIWQHTLSEKLHKLSEILRVNEIVATIPNHCRQLILIPHRYLHLFPLHALPFTLEGGHGGTAPTKYLLDCFPDGVKYAPSLQLLELVQNRIKTRTSPAPELQPLFAIQNPTEDLSNADMEVQIIKQRFDTHDILIKQQATKIAFNENLKNLSNASYIHFSCHGVFNFDYPLLSLLALADSIEENNDTDAERRYVTMRSGRKAIPEKCLTLREIFADLELSKCNLVTLSACETGLTSSTEMTDEYIGLPSGFLYAGSMNVVSTLWSVDDFATAILMIKFYQELLPKVSVAVALNAAQNWMRAVTKEDFGVWVKSLNLDKKSGQSVELWLVSSLEERPFSHPKYWAAFCATGY